MRAGPALEAERVAAAPPELQPGQGRSLAARPPRAPPGDKQGSATGAPTLQTAF